MEQTVRTGNLEVTIYDQPYPRFYIKSLVGTQTTIMGHVVEYGEQAGNIFITAFIKNMLETENGVRIK